MSSNAERRKAKRRPILDTFSIFTVVPKKGIHKLVVHDLSELGVGFDLDTEGEVHADFPVSPGSGLELRLYLNQSLYLPLGVEVVRVDERGPIRKIGARFDDKTSASYKAFLAFLQLLDSVIDVVRIEEHPA